MCVSLLFSSFLGVCLCISESGPGKLAAEACFVMEARGLARARRKAIENDRKLTAPLKLSQLLGKSFEECVSIAADNESLEHALEVLSNAAIVGIDCEWASGRCDNTSPVALVQVSTSQRALDHDSTVSMFRKEKKKKCCDVTYFLKSAVSIVRQLLILIVSLRVYYHLRV